MDTDATDPTMPADAGAPAKAVEQLVVALELRSIKPSPTNPRKVFPEGPLAELAESIKSKGVLSPVLVRPAKKGDGYELVFGERRWRASKLAKVATIPAMVREMTDQEVLEAQVIENLQRADVHPLEEADGYRALMDKHRYSAEDLAAKVGKSKAYVYGRLKLCDLKGQKARDLFVSGELSASIALLIARIPVSTLQDQAAAGVARGVEVDAHKRGAVDKATTVLQPFSYRAAQLYLQENFMLRLGTGLFPMADPTLVKDAGACTSCVYRTGNQRDLFEDVKSADVCTNPPCYQKKRDAQWARDAAAAKEKGLGALTTEESAKLFNSRTDDPSHVWLDYSSKFKNADEHPPWDFHANGKSWSELFGGKDKVPVVLAQDPNGKVWRLIDINKAKAALQKAGKLSGGRDKASRARQAGSAKGVLTRNKNLEAAAKRKELIECDVLTKISEAAAKAPEISRFRALIHALDADTYGHVGTWLVDRHGVKKPKDWRDNPFTKVAETETAARKLLAILVDAAVSMLVREHDIASPKLQAFGKAVGVDVVALVKAATAKHAPPEEPAPAKKPAAKTKGKR